MGRKKKPADEATPAESATAIAVVEPEITQPPQTPVPAWIDGPEMVPEPSADGPANPAAKNWGPPYKTIVTSPEKGFEMGENRRFKQRVFRFAEKPGDEVIAKLEESGFVYRAGEKAWTIQANPDTRKLSDELAREFAGRTAAMAR